MWRPVIVDIKVKRFIPYNGFNSSPKFGTVPIRKGSFLVNPQAKAEYALWGSDSGIFDNNFSSSTHSSVCSTYSFSFDV